MTFFSDYREILQKQKVFILGSFKVVHFEKLQIIKKGLIEKGITDTYIATDKEMEPTHEYLNKSISTLHKVRDLFNNSDFNIFILFEDNNDSVIGELGEFIKKENFGSKLKKTLICVPRNYSPTIILGIIGEYKIIKFEYDYEIDIIQYCYIFIKRNLID